MPCPASRRARIVASILVAAAGTAAAADEPAPEAETRPATLLGITGLSLNGRVQPHARPGTWHFDYGPTKEYGAKSAAQAIPPRLAAHYHETWDEGWNGWRSWDSKHLHFRDGGASGGYIRYEAIQKDDHNHDDGVGTVHLAKYMYPGRFAPIPSAYLAAGDPDFRDAVIRLAVRGVDWKPNGAELMWWSQAQSNIEVNPTDATLGPAAKHQNWCYTGHHLTDLLATGKWERAEYRLLNDTNHWSYCGSNGVRNLYDTYWSIGEVQRHLNVDYFHMVVFVDPQNRPAGAIDFDEFGVDYRNYSLLFPPNGAKLAAAPAGSADDPAALTDGWRHGAKKSWASAANPAGPLEFTYELAAPVTIESAQIHQHAEWPAREVEVLVSADGKSWQPLVRGDLPEKSPNGPNFAFLLKRGLQAAANQVKVRILSGFRPERWGLGEIELFGRGAVLATDDDWCCVNADITGLKPGETCHYRLVVNGPGGAVAGRDQEVALPRDAKPQVVTGPASRIQGGTAKVEGRLNPLGTKTQFHFEYGPTERYGQETKPQYGGLQITPRLAFASLSDLKPGTACHYRLVAVNEHGTSYGADAVFTAK